MILLILFDGFKIKHSISIVYTQTPILTSDRPNITDKSMV